MECSQGSSTNTNSGVLNTEQQQQKQQQQYQQKQQSKIVLPSLQRSSSTVLVGQYQLLLHLFMDDDVSCNDKCFDGASDDDRLPDVITLSWLWVICNETSNLMSEIAGDSFSFRRTRQNFAGFDLSK